MLRRFRDRAVYGGWASVLGAGVGFSPVRSRVLLKERMQQDLGLVRPLDYSGGQIMLHVDSLVELTTRLRSCAKEPETVAWIEKYVRGGDVVFDIGANVGVYSLVIDRHTGGEAKVFAFEPGAATFVQLTRNLALNGCLETVIPLPVAFGGETGITTFNYSSFASGSARHGMGEPVDALGKPFEPVLRQPILVYRLDDFIELFRIGVPAHMKLDVDGPELDILKGASRTLANRGVRTVMVELEPTQDAAREATTLLEGLGFELVSVHSHGEVTETSNYLFVREQG